MGIPVDGKYETFRDSLVSKDFIYVSSFETSYKFIGIFANEAVTVNVLVSPRTNTVCKVIVYFQEHEKWKELKEDYFAKKELYRSKYPLDKDFEFFIDGYEDGDGYEARAVMRDKCRYVSFFLATGGHVTVEITKTMQVKVVYEDRENIKVAQKELEDNALDDI